MNALQEKRWPVPENHSTYLPPKGMPGSFWEDRGDRYHCGIDIYADYLSLVTSTEDGTVIDAGIFTSPEIVAYWNTTYYVIVQHLNGLIAKYAELDSAVVMPGDPVQAGQIIGQVGKVLNVEKISEEAPLYIQKLKQNCASCMLHFELYRSSSAVLENYRGGNKFDEIKPDNLLDPTQYLKSLLD